MDRPEKKMTTYDKDPDTLKTVMMQEQSLPLLFEDYKPDKKERKKGSQQIGQ